MANILSTLHVYMYIHYKLIHESTKISEHMIYVYANKGEISTSCCTSTILCYTYRNWLTSQKVKVRVFPK